MNDSIFSDLLNEYQSIGIGTLIYSLVFGIVSEVTRFYPPTVYSPNGVWDEDAVSGICNDFIINKLLNKGWLDSYFLSLDSKEGLKRVLKRDFRHYLISRKTRTEKNNIYLRVKKILNNNPVSGDSTHSGSVWGLTGRAQEDVVQDPHDVMMVLETVQLPPAIRYRSDSVKISPLLGNPDLLRLIEETMIILDKGISLGVLVEAICYRLGVVTDEIISLDDTFGNENDQFLADTNPSSDTQVETNVSAIQIAEDIYERLSDRQREILALHLELQAPTLVEIGEHLGISKSTVSNELFNIERVIRNSKPSSYEIDLVIPLLKELFNRNQTTQRTEYNS
jgi:predicted DNA-binding protein YlxM (UPF0122 family)